MATAEEVDAAYKPTQTRAVICMDSDLVLEIERLEEQLDRQTAVDDKLNEPDKAPAIAQQILDLQEQARASDAEFVFKDIGRLPFSNLRRAHPATDAQQAEVLEAAREIDPDATARLPWNPETFPPALLAASCVEPTGTDLSWWVKRWATWGTGQTERLWEACIGAQGGVNEAPKASRALLRTLASAQK